MRLILLFVMLAGVVGAAPSNSLTIVQWNVENLFDTHDDPANSGDDEFTPAGSAGWTEALYSRKLAHLAEILTPLEADILCVEEIENRRVLEDLAARLQQQGHAYPFIVHRDGTDHRGIDVAILSRLAPVTNRWLTPVEGQRDILVATFASQGAAVTVMVNHWKSWRGAAKESAATRTEEAAAVRVEVDKILGADSNACIVVLGDFNDNCNGPAIKNHLRSTLNLDRVLHGPGEGWLYNLHGFLPRGARGSLYYPRGKVWRSFDSMSVSRAMVERSATNTPAWRVMPKSYAIVRPAQMQGEHGAPVPFRQGYEDQAGGEFVEGYSDHFPVKVTIGLE